jgi:broad specificity phosphatase PhoE
MAEVAEGVRGWISERRQDSAGCTVGLVGHASTVRIVVAEALNLPLQEAIRLSVPPAGAAVVRFWPDGGSCLDSLVASPESVETATTSESSKGYPER